MPVFFLVFASGRSAEHTHKVSRWSYMIFSAETVVAYVLQQYLCLMELSRLSSCRSLFLQSSQVPKSRTALGHVELQVSLVTLCKASLDVCEVFRMIKFLLTIVYKSYGNMPNVFWASVRSGRRSAPSCHAVNVRIRIAHAGPIWKKGMYAFSGWW